MHQRQKHPIRPMLTLYASEEVDALYLRSLSQAKKALSRLTVCSENELKSKGLSGWVFEQTIQFCLRKELTHLGLKPEVEEQVKLGNRAVGDLRVGRAVVEIKKSGLFSPDGAKRYRKHRRYAEELGCKYLFFTGVESHRPYRDAICEAIGRKHVYFLEDGTSEWVRFVKVVARLSKGS